MSKQECETCHQPSRGDRVCDCWRRRGLDLLRNYKSPVPLLSEC